MVAFEEKHGLEMSRGFGIAWLRWRFLVAKPGLHSESVSLCQLPWWATTWPVFKCTWPYPNVWENGCDIEQKDSLERVLLIEN